MIWTVESGTSRLRLKGYPISLVWKLVILIKYADFRSNTPSVLANKEFPTAILLIFTFHT